MVTLQRPPPYWRDYYPPHDKIHTNWTLPWNNVHNKDNTVGSSKNCLIFASDYPNTRSWQEYQCETESPKDCPCAPKRQPILQLKGACSKLLDKFFTTRQLQEGGANVFLVGLKHSRIDYNKAGEKWVLTDAKSSVVAEARAAGEMSYVLGKHEWIFTGDEYKCHGGETYTTILKLTGCNLDEFTCNDGQCVSMELRCNQLTNCRDESDEMDCKLLILKNTYNKKVPPIIATGQANFDPVHVNISVSLLKIVSMEEVQHKIDLQFAIVLEWKENRAKYHNLKKKTSLNALTDDEIERLWLPYVIYSNTDMKEAVQLDKDVQTTVVISKEGMFTRGGEDTLDEVEIFDGQENRLSMYQTYTKSFQCQYRLQRYPFDIQASTIAHVETY